MCRALTLALATLTLAPLACAPPCPGGKGCPLAATGPSGGPLPLCLAGAWKNASTGSCRPIPCSPDAGPPECGRDDCTQHGYLVFDPTSDDSNRGVVSQGNFVRSDFASTSSAVIPPTRGTYSIADGKLVWGSSPQIVTCSATQLVLGEVALKLRASEAETLALRQQLSGSGTWTAQPAP